LQLQIEDLRIKIEKDLVEKIEACKQDAAQEVGMAEKRAAEPIKAAKARSGKTK